MANGQTGFDIPIGFNQADLKATQNDLNKFVDDVKKGLDTIVKSNDDVKTSFDGIKVPTDEINKLNTEFAELQRTATASIREQKNALAQLVTTGKKGSKEFNDLEKELKSNIVEAKKLEKAFDDIESSYEVDIDINTEKQIKGLDKLKAKLKSVGKVAAIGGVAILAAGLAQSVKSAVEVEKAMSKVRALTGLTGEEAEKLKTVGQDLYVAGFGDSLGETIEGVGRLKQSLGKVVDEKDFAEVSKILAGVANATGEELDAVGAKSRTFIQNFNGDAVEAANLIAFVSQNANNAQGDVLDTLDEYSLLVKQAGISSQGFAKFLADGIEKGARNTDKLADGLKEAQIRIKAGDYRNAFKGLTDGLPAASASIVDEIEGIIQNAEAGKISIGEALQLSGEKVTEGFKSGDISKSLADKLIVGIAGTPAEENGTLLFAGLLAGLDNSENDSKLSERGKKAADLYSSSIAANTGGFEGLQRTIEVLLADVGDAILPVLAVVTGAIKQILPLLTPVIEIVAKSLAPILVIIIDLVGKLMPTITKLIEKILPALMPVVEQLGELLGDLLVPLMPLLDIFIELILQVLPPLITYLQFVITVWGGLLKVVVKFVAVIYEKLYTVINDLVKNVLKGFTGSLDGVSRAFGKLSGFIDKIFKKFSKFLGMSKDVTKSTDEQSKAVAGLGAETQNVVDTTEKQATVLTKTVPRINEYSGAVAKTTAEIKKLNEALIENVTGMYIRETAIEKEKRLLQEKADAEMLQFTQLTATQQSFNDTLQNISVEGFAKNLSKISVQAEQTTEVFEGLEAGLNSLANLDFAETTKNLGKLFTSFDSAEISIAIEDFDLEQLQNISAALNQFAINASSAFVDAIDDGGIKEGLISLGVSIIDGLEALIPAVIAKLFITDVATFGPLGLAKAAGTSAALYAALELAKGALQGAEGGGLIDGNYRGAVGKTDNRLMAVGDGEFIMNRQAVKTGDNLATLVAMNNGEDLSKFAINNLGDIVLRSSDKTSTTSNFNTNNLENEIRNLGDKLQSQKIEIYDRGKIEINDNRAIQYKKNNSHRG